MRRAGLKRFLRDGVHRFAVGERRNHPPRAAVAPVARRVRDRENHTPTTAAQRAELAGSGSALLWGDLAPSLRRLAAPTARIRRCFGFIPAVMQ